MALIALITGVTGSVHAYTGNLQIPGEGVTQIITLEDGSILVGRITEIRADQIKFQTDLGEMTIGVTKIKTIKEVTGNREIKEVKETAMAEEKSQIWFPNPNRTRLLVGPTARTLKAGDGYFYDLWIFFPGLAYGITDNFMISGGASVIPGVDDQMFYIMPKFGFTATKDMNLAVSMTAFRLWDETFYFGLGGMTYGTDDKSVTCALGVAFTNDAVADKPAAMLGGEYRLSRRAALVGESWFIPGKADQGMLGMGALRLMGEQMTVDVGVGLSYDDKSNEKDINGNPEKNEVHWLPYVDFVWNF
ncbi:MAG: hypothetical protein NT028_11385 [candidate division Zixibacteria bacterium]|nr:hypothetical protein [candidate division Zixibacteria bacterium]